MLIKQTTWKNMLFSEGFPQWGFWPRICCCCIFFFFVSQSTVLHWVLISTTKRINCPPLTSLQRQTETLPTALKKEVNSHSFCGSVKCDGCFLCIITVDCLDTADKWVTHHNVFWLLENELKKICFQLKRFTIIYLKHWGWEWSVLNLKKKKYK